MDHSLWPNLGLRANDLAIVSIVFIEDAAAPPYEVDRTERNQRPLGKLTGLPVAEFADFSFGVGLASVEILEHPVASLSERSPARPAPVLVLVAD